MQVSSLPFSALPHQSRLFLEYQSDPVSLRKFFPNAVHSATGLVSYIPTVLGECEIERSLLCDALTEINERIGSTRETTGNIDLLRQPETVAIVTGQQAGLFTGPLYTIYKALSAIKMAQNLTASGTKAVPVFWAATEDHDFAEVSESFFVGASGDIVRCAYSPDAYIENQPVGSVEIDGGIEATIDEIFAQMPRTEFSADVRSVLSASWQNGATFGDAFLATLARLLGKYGVIFIDPMNAQIKRLCAPICAEAVKHADAITENVRVRSAELENTGFHAQVVVEENYFPFFWQADDGRRTALRKLRDGIYRAKDGKREFDLSELERIASDEPQRLISGVMLRPVVQDFLLPTACYFGGAAEIAYFAQNSEVYRVLNRPVTPIFHRQSFTIVEAKHRRLLDKFDLQFSGLFAGLEEIRLRLAETTIALDTARLFAEVEERINTELNRLDQNLSQIDSTVAANLVKRRRKIVYHIAALRKKAMLAQIRNDETLNRQLDSLFNSLLPKGALQERSVNVFTYLNKFGPGFIDWLYDAIDLEDKGHRIIDL